MKRFVPDSLILFCTGIILCIAIIFRGLFLVSGGEAANTKSAIDPVIGTIASAVLVFIVGGGRGIVDKLSEKAKLKSDADLRTQEIQIKEKEALTKSREAGIKEREIEKLLKEKRMQIEDDLTAEITAAREMMMLFLSKYDKKDVLDDLRNEENRVKYLNHIAEIDASIIRVNLLKSRAMPNDKDFFGYNFALGYDDKEAEVSKDDLRIVMEQHTRLLYYLRMIGIALIVGKSKSYEEMLKEQFGDIPKGLPLEQAKDTETV